MFCGGATSVGPGRLDHAFLVYQPTSGDSTDPPPAPRRLAFIGCRLWLRSAWRRGVLYFTAHGDAVNPVGRRPSAPSAPLPEKKDPVEAQRALSVAADGNSTSSQPRTVPLEFLQSRYTSWTPDPRHPPSSLHPSPGARPDDCSCWASFSGAPSPCRRKASIPIFGGMSNMAGTLGTVDWNAPPPTRSPPSAIPGSITKTSAN